MAEHKWPDYVVEDALALMAQGKGDKEIADYLTQQHGEPGKPVPVGTVKRWRSEKFGPAVTKRLEREAEKKKAEEAKAAAQAKQAEEAEQAQAEEVPTSLQPATMLEAAPPLAPAPPDLRDIGQLAEDALREQLRTSEEMAKWFRNPAFLTNPLLVASADRMADLYKQNNDCATRLLEARARYIAALNAPRPA